MSILDQMERWLKEECDFPWNEGEILRYLGHHGQEIPDHVKELMENCRRELEQAAAAKSVWKEYPLKVEDHEIGMNGCG